MLFFPIEGYECKASYCNLLRFQTKDELMSHTKNKHVVWTQKYVNFCQECKILFKSDEDLKKHYQQAHPDKNTGVTMIIDCDLVGKKHALKKYDPFHYVRFSRFY